MVNRYLTKSRFKLARECPTKLFYTGKNEQFENQSLDDSFLKALACGGFQVGELAKLTFPGGHMIETLDYDEALNQTNDLLQRDSVVIYEAAIRHHATFVRVDILVKRGSTIQLIEVKSKSFDPDEDGTFYDSRAIKGGKKKLKKKWLPYLEDIAFQTYVARRHFTGCSVTPYLMLTDKSKTTTVSCLNQRFLLSSDNRGRTKVVVKEDTTPATIGDSILRAICVTEEVELILEGEKDQSFQEIVDHYCQSYVPDKKITPQIGTQCKKCEFKSNDPLKSGFHHCWKEATRLSESELQGPFTFDVWNFSKAAKLMEDGIYLIKDIPEGSFEIKESDRAGFSQSERQWKQIEAVQSGSKHPVVDHKGLMRELAGWKYPLHFIDFETTMVAIPYNEGRKPYEQIAFQFSHHQVNADGSIDHKGQYINQKAGHFPNFDFLRALKAELDGDDGTILRYSHHENTVLCQIYDQLETSDEPDKSELQAWIQTITESKSKKRTQWQGPRSMVDMWDMVKRYYYHPLTNGSNSIKKVLPASLFQSETIRERYSKAIYGSKQIPSLNYQNWTWVQLDSSGQVVDPYKLLPPIFDGIDTEKLDLLVDDDELADGGAAMMAYAKMQFTEMSDIERKAIANALLKYCELDTFAMVLIFEHWAEITGISIGKVA
jgi:hypothetical protein